MVEREIRSGVETPGQGLRAPHDPLADKHRSKSFERDWRCVNYARLNEPYRTGGAGGPDGPASELLRPDWRPMADRAPATERKPYAAQFASFVGGPIHAEVERLPPGDRGRRAGAPSDDDL